MFIETLALALFGLVMTLVGLLIGIGGTLFLTIYKKGVKGDKEKNS